MVLRFARTYKPYRIELIEFRHDKYIGTEKPRNFSSLVRLVDEARGVDRTVKIWMNNPLRYAGETFYQSSFEPGKDLTILQVVRNDGWMIPYVSCMIVAVGLTAHMGAQLLEFLRRRAAR
jgi:cytochrome c biogenesis protein ResB